jgi:ribonucleoside-diphosphate reductase subunit M1
MYLHFNERSGLMAPLIAEDVYEIIMKVRDAFLTGNL